MRKLIMPDDAYALRPVRFLPKDKLRYYWAITFPRGPKDGCCIYYRRCAVFGGVANGESDAAGICDVLDENHNIIADFWLTRKGLEYLIRTLKCRVEPDADADC